MPEQGQTENGDRLEGLDFLREALLGEQLQEPIQDYQAKINNLEEQINWVRDEMRAQGNQVQHVLDQKINEVLQMIQMSQFSATQPPVTPPSIPQQTEPQPQESTPPVPPVVPQNSTLPTPVTIPIAREIPREDSPKPTTNNEVIPSPEATVEIPTPPMTDLNLDDFSQQINAILGGSSSPTVPPPAPVAAPSPPASQTPTPQVQAVPPVSPPPAPRPPVIAVDEMNQRQNLRNFLAEEEVMQLRQTNDELDAKLRQVDDCLATSPQPMHDLLPLMTELVQLKVQEVKSVQSAPSVAPVEQATVSSTPQVVPPKVKEPKTPVLGRGAKKLIFAFVLFLLLIPLGFYGYWLWRAFVLERDVAIALDATPELSLYRLDPEVKGNTLYLTGKLPSQSLSDRAADVAQGTVPTLALENHIVVVEALLDPAQKQTEIDKVLNPLNGINGIQVKAELAGDRLTLKGTVLRQSDIDVIIAAVENISGISQVINKIQVEAQPISIQLYFDQNSAAIKPDDLTNKLERVKTFLQQHPDLNVRITGYQHPSEAASNVALKRAQTTQILLQDQGIDRRRIVTLGVNQSPPNITPSEPIWLSRTVLFDVIPPTTPAQPQAPATP